MPRRRPISLCDSPSSRIRASTSFSVTRTLVRVPDGRSAGFDRSEHRLVELVLDLLPADGEVGCAALAGGADRGETAVEAPELELEALGVEGCGRRLAAARADRELGHQCAQLVVVFGNGGGRVVRVGTQVLGGAPQD